MLSTNRREPWQNHPLSPRKWQARALPIILDALSQPRPKGVVVQAVMGAGKSVLLAELCYLTVSRSAVVVVVAPKKMLVRQLADTISYRLGPDSVGMFFSEAKDDEAPVVVTCNASFKTLSKRLSARGRVVNLVIFDEAHRSETRTILDAVPTLSPSAIIGFTATPFRSQANERLSLFDEVIVSYDFKEAINDKVLVPYRVVTWNEDRARAAGVDSNDREVVCYVMIKDADGPGLISADTVDDAHWYKQFLLNRGFPTEVITGETPGPERSRIIAELEAGKIRAIIHVNVLSEGADFPFLQWVCLRRSASSKIRFPQEVGRVLRAHPGKTHAVVYDPHALSVVRSLDEDAGLWRPAKIVAFVPEDDKKRKRLERWLTARDFTSTVLVSELEGFDSLMNTLIQRQIGRVVIYDHDSLDPTQRTFIKGASANWQSDRLVKISQVVPTPAERAVLTWTLHAPHNPEVPDVASQRAAVDSWVERLGRVVVDDWTAREGIDAQPALEAHGWFDLDDDNAKAPVVVFNGGCLPVAVAARLRNMGRRIVEVRPDPKAVEALVLAPGESFLHEVHMLLDGLGHIQRKPVSVYARGLPSTEAQVAYLNTLKHTVRAWSPPGPPAVLDKLRPLVIDGLRGNLPLGVMSDLLGVLRGVHAAGGWLWGNPL